MAWIRTKSENNVKNLLFPIGAVIESTTCDTMEKVVENYGGTTWIQHTGYILRGASSGVIANDAQKTGGADSVSYTPASSDGKTGSTTLTTAMIPAHTHGSKSLTGSFKRAYDNWAFVKNQPIQFTSASGICSRTSTNKTVHNDYLGTIDVSDVTVYDTISINATHTHDSVGGGQGHTHTFTGKAATIDTLPQYKSVYIWERTA